MKFMIALSALVACSAAQVAYPGFAGGPFATAYAGGFAYAPSFGYANFGSPAPVAASPSAAIAQSSGAAPVRTALEAFAPHQPFFYHQQQALAAPYYNLYNPYTSFSPFAAAPAPFQPTLKLAEEGEDDATVEEDQPTEPRGPVLIRQIFPVFPSDLRDASEGIVFARPDQIIPVGSGDVIKEDSDELPAVVVADLTIPSGIAQATQPRFFQGAFSRPVISF